MLCMHRQWQKTRKVRSIGFLHQMLCELFRRNFWHIKRYWNRWSTVYKFWICLFLFCIYIRLKPYQYNTSEEYERLRVSATCITKKGPSDGYLTRNWQTGKRRLLVELIVCQIKHCWLNKYCMDAELTENCLGIKRGGLLLRFFASARTLLGLRGENRCRWHTDAILLQGLNFLDKAWELIVTVRKVVGDLSEKARYML